MRSRVHCRATQYSTVQYSTVQFNAVKCNPSSPRIKSPILGIETPTSRWLWKCISSHALALPGSSHPNERENAEMKKKVEMEMEIRGDGELRGCIEMGIGLKDLLHLHMMRGEEKRRTWDRDGKWSSLRIKRSTLVSALLNCTAKKQKETDIERNKSTDRRNVFGASQKKKKSVIQREASNNENKQSR